MKLPIGLSVFVATIAAKEGLALICSGTYTIIVRQHAIKLEVVNNRLDPIGNACHSAVLQTLSWELLLWEWRSLSTMVWKLPFTRA